jgi:DNA-directed RNA polymerase specialized sigma24 family protein
VSLTEALRAGSPHALGALYDEYAGALYAYCHVMVGDEAGDALRDAFVAVARDPGAAPGDDAELPVWLHSLTRAECVRRGALERGVVTVQSADPLRHVLGLLRPHDREVLALSNALDPAETAQVLGVRRDTAETLVREAQSRLEQAAASVRGRETQDSVMLASLGGEALHRLVTVGHEPSAQQREWVLSACAAAGRAPGGGAVFDTDGTPLPQDAFSAQADEATHQFPAVSSGEPATAPLRRVEGISAAVPPNQPAPAGLASPETTSPEAGLAEAGLAEAAPARWESADWESAAWESAGWESAGSGPDGDAGEQPPAARATHAKPRRPLGRRLVPVVVLAACAAAAAGTAVAWPNSHDATRTGASVRQSAPPSRTAGSAPARDQTSTPPLMIRSGASPTPTGAAAEPPAAAPSDSAPAEEPSSATPPRKPVRPARPARPTRHPHPATTWPRPHHTAAPGDGHGTTGPHRPGRTCHGTSGQAPRCTRPHPWHPGTGSQTKPWW